MKVAIVIPMSNMSNNIYSLSETSYLSGFLKKHGLDVSINMLELEEIEQFNQNWGIGNVILILQWEGFQLIHWLDEYEKTNRNKSRETILFGLTARVYGEKLIKEYSSLSMYVEDDLYVSILKKFIEVRDGEILESEELDSIDLEYLDQINLPMIPLITSRGCLGQCNFCALGITNRAGYRILKSPEEIVSDISKYYKMGNSNFYFVDSCFLCGEDALERSSQILKLIEENKIKIRFYIETRIDKVNNDVFSNLSKAGLRSVLLGVENISSIVQKRFNKIIEKESVLNALHIIEGNRVNVDLTWMMFDSYTKKGEIAENLKFILENKLYRYSNLNSLFRRVVLHPKQRVNMEIQNLIISEEMKVKEAIALSYNYPIYNEEVLLFEKWLKVNLLNWEVLLKNQAGEQNSISERKKAYNILIEKILNSLIYILENDETIYNNEHLDFKIYELFLKEVQR